MPHALPDTPTLANWESAFAGESMAHMKYKYFARLARAAGDLPTAEIFEATAAQEIEHAMGHLDLLHPAAATTPQKALELAIAGETYEYTQMYPGFRDRALQEGDAAAAAEFDEQIHESKEHAAAVRATLEKAAKRFAALAKVEKRHAERYQAALSDAQARSAAQA